MHSLIAILATRYVEHLEVRLQRNPRAPARAMAEPLLKVADWDVYRAKNGQDRIFRVLDVRLAWTARVSAFSEMDGRNGQLRAPET